MAEPCTCQTDVEGTPLCAKHERLFGAPGELSPQTLRYLLVDYDNAADKRLTRLAHLEALLRAWAKAEAAYEPALTAYDRDPCSVDVRSEFTSAINARDAAQKAVFDEARKLGEGSKT